MNVILIRSDLYETSEYHGKPLWLPASRDEIQDAMDRARIKAGQEYKIVECLSSEGGELPFIPESPPLAELNFLAWRISTMDEYERIAFAGCAIKGDESMGMRDLINLTYNLDEVHVISARNDRELGEFYVYNDFIDAISNIPPEYQEEMLELLDYEKIGRREREAEGGIYYKGCYVIKGSGGWNEVYDGTHLPDLPEEPPYVLKLRLMDAALTPAVPDSEHTVSLLLPAAEKEIMAAIEQLGVTSLEECVICQCESPFPALEYALSLSEDIDKMNLLAEHIRELEHRGEFPKFKAVFEIAYGKGLDYVLDLTRNLDCFDFYPELSSLKDYAMQKFLKRYQIPEDAPELKLIDFSRSGFKWMQETNIHATDYGVICRNDREMMLEYSHPQLGQQML